MSKSIRNILPELDRIFCVKTAAYLKPKAARLMAKMLLVVRAKALGGSPTSSRLMQILRKARKDARKFKSY